MLAFLAGHVLGTLPGCGLALLSASSLTLQALFWEALDLPLRELEQLKTLKVRGFCSLYIHPFWGSLPCSAVGLLRKLGLADSSGRAWSVKSSMTPAHHHAVEVPQSPQVSALGDEDSVMIKAQHTCVHKPALWAMSTCGGG